MIVSNKFNVEILFFMYSNFVVNSFNFFIFLTNSFCYMRNGVSQHLKVLSQGDFIKY